MGYSGREINYSVRPAKNVERKIMCDFFSQANRAFDIDQYRYLGFGASYFTDFILFHNELNIENMISIEKCEELKERFEFNKPYGNIIIEYGESSDVLRNKIEWDSKTKDIIWLDYDEGLSEDKINEIEFCVNKIVSGSFIIVSFNSTIKPDGKGNRTDEVRTLFNEDKLPFTFTEDDLTPNCNHLFFNRLLKICIEKALFEKNSIYVEECDKYSYKQIMYFKYKDGAPMKTLGYIFYKNSDADKIASCKFSQIEGYSETETPYNIEIPNFTFREIQEINKYAPNADEAVKEIEFIHEKDIREYLKIYRYYPHIKEINYSN